MSDRETASINEESDSISKKQKYPQDNDDGNTPSNVTNSTQSSVTPVNLQPPNKLKAKLSVFKSKASKRVKLFFNTLRGAKDLAAPLPVTETFRIEVPTQSATVPASATLNMSDNAVRRASYQRRVLEAQAAREIAELKTKMLKAEQARLEAEKERQLEQTALEKKKLKAEKMLIHAKLLEGIALLDGEGQQDLKSKPESSKDKTNNE